MKKIYPLNLLIMIFLVFIYFMTSSLLKLSLRYKKLQWGGGREVWWGIIEEEIQ